MECVVFVHGIWMTGLEMSLLRKRVERAGYSVCSFRYPSLRKSPSQNADALNGFLTSLKREFSPSKFHFIAHSLGGVVLSHYFEKYKESKMGRVVLLGSPLLGSDTARAYKQFPLTGLFLGQSINEGLLGDCPAWPVEIETGMIAGTKGVGVGSILFGKLAKPNDGTVSVEETRAPQLTAHLTVPCSHLSILFSKSVANQAVGFLQGGKF